MPKCPSQDGDPIREQHTQVEASRMMCRKFSMCLAHSHDRSGDLSIYSAYLMVDIVVVARQMVSCPIILSRSNCYFMYTLWATFILLISLLAQF